MEDAERETIATAVSDDDTAVLRGFIAADPARAYRVFTDLVEDVTAQMSSRREALELEWSHEADAEYRAWRPRAKWFQKHLLVWQREAKEARHQAATQAASNRDTFQKLHERGVASIDVTFVLSDGSVEFDAYTVDNPGEPFVSGTTETLKMVLGIVFTALDNADEMAGLRS